MEKGREPDDVEALKYVVLFLRKVEVLFKIYQYTKYSITPYYLALIQDFEKSLNSYDSMDCCNSRARKKIVMTAKEDILRCIRIRLNDVYIDTSLYREDTSEFEWIEMNNSSGKELIKKRTFHPRWKPEMLKLHYPV